MVIHFLLSLSSFLINMLSTLAVRQMKRVSMAMCSAVRWSDSEKRFVLESEAVRSEL